MVFLKEKERELKLLGLLPEREISLVVEQGISIRLPVFEGRRALAEEKIKKFQKKHRMTYQQLKIKGLPVTAKEELHEDFVEWGHWERVYKEAEKIIEQFKQIKGPIGRG